MILGAVGLGVVIGLVMGALGGGGSVLTVPALVFVLGLSAQEATTASLVIVGVTAAAATVGHARTGHTRWRTGGLLALLGAPASVLGSVLNRDVDPDVLLLAFSGVMLLAGAGMLVQARSGGAQDEDPPGDPRTTGRSSSTPPGTAAAVRAAATPTAGRAGPAVRLAAAGLLIGVLTGLFGVGGGFVLVPVLVLLLRTPMPVAIGTSLLVIGLNCAVALTARVAHGTFAWDVIVPFTLAAVVGSLGGKRVADRSHPESLTGAFAVVLLLVAVYVAVRAALALL